MTYYSSVTTYVNKNMTIYFSEANIVAMNSMRLEEK